MFKSILAWLGFGWNKWRTEKSNLVRKEWYVSEYVYKTYELLRRDNKLTGDIQYKLVHQFSILKSVMLRLASQLMVTISPQLLVLPVRFQSTMTLATAEAGF